MGSKVGKTGKGVKGGKPVPKARGKVGKPAISSRPSRSGVKAVNYNVDDALKSALAHCAPAKKVRFMLSDKKPYFSCLRSPLVRFLGQTG